jgi:hypothetical protein
MVSDETREGWYQLFHALSEGAIRELYEAIRRALAEDDALPTGRKKYGVREFSDFGLEATVLERVFTDRGMKFEKIKW